MIIEDYKHSGTCSKSSRIVIDDEGKIAEVQIEDGCPGNTLGLCHLLVGMDAAEAADRMRGIHCRQKPTSCPDQLARAIDEALSANR